MLGTMAIFEALITSMEGSLFIGFVMGLLVGLTVAGKSRGCLILIAVPVAMVFYVDWWQDRHPEALRSTSALDFLFGPLWPSLGAVGGLCTVWWLRAWIARP